jgi:NDP-sugar pyrophosphorylase family protein
MKAMILAAGFGTRLRPVTYIMPKPMVPVCNRPLIAHAVDAFLGAGIHDMIINLHHLPEAMERFLRDFYGDEVRFTFSHEAEILGTGGGVRRVRKHLENEDVFFLANADTIQLPPFDDLLRARAARDSLAALTLRHPPRGDRFTPVWLENGLITGFGSGRGEALMFSGSHAISSRIFRYLPDKEFSGIVNEVYQPLIDSGRETIAGIVDDGVWFDIGTPQRYMQATGAIIDLTAKRAMELARGSRIGGDSIVGEGVKISGRVVHSSIGARSLVHGIVEESAIWDDCLIGRGVAVRSSIVGHGVDLTRAGVYDHVLICRDDSAIPRDPEYRFDAGNVIVPI